ncbi:MAG TPA: TOMM precursor leader peptide-binding protein [Acidimicrobiales bacterium]|nr:TOMM precursor leader peptide-binding protein [Acidimicrobiales bacterium]
MIFAGEQRSFYLESAGIATLVALLDGASDLPTLCKKMAGICLPEEVLADLARLDALGALADGRARASASLAETAYFDIAGVDPGVGSVAVLSDRRLWNGDCGRFVDAITTAGSAVEIVHGIERLASNRSLGAAPPVLVVPATDYLAPELLELNSWALARSQVLALCRPEGATPWIGPVLAPGSTACLACLAYRMSANRQLDRYLRHTQGRAVPTGLPIASTPGTLTAVAGMLAPAVYEAIGDVTRSELAGQIISLDLLSYRLDRHLVIRRPQCPACGDPSSFPTPRRVTLTSRPKCPGSERTRSLTETLRAVEPHISPISGAVLSVRTVATGTDLFHAAAAGHPFAAPSPRFDVVARSVRGTTSGGKGRTAEQARMSAIGEAIERGTAVYRGDEAVRHAAYDEVAGEAVDPRLLFLFSRDQYEHAAERNATSRNRFEHIPRPLDPASPIDWTEAWTPDGGDRVLVPSAFCYFGHPDLTKDFYLCDSNGTASGNVVEEAIASGFYELIERDSVALWWYNRLRRPAVDLDDVGDSYLDAVRGYHAAAGRQVWAIDLTADSGVPVFAAVSRRVDHPVEDLLVGFGCHLDPKVALDRAVDELGQFMPSVSYRRPDGSTRYHGHDREMLHWLQNARLVENLYLAPDPGAPPVRLGEMKNRSSDDVSEDVRTCIAAAHAMGLDLYVVDLTRPEVDLAVVKVIVPGLRHFWRRLAPGRLYDTPVALGWLDRPSAEADLNPETVFF